MSGLEIAQGLVHRWDKGAKNPCIGLYLSGGPRGQKLDRIMSRSSQLPTAAILQTDTSTCNLVTIFPMCLCPIYALSPSEKLSL